MLDVLTGVLIVISLVTAMFCLYKVVTIASAAKRAALIEQLQGPDPFAPNPLRVSLTREDVEKEITLALTKVQKWHGWLIKTSQGDILTAEANWSTSLEEATGKESSASTPMKTKVKAIIHFRKVGIGREIEVSWKYEGECVGWHDPTIRCEDPEIAKMCELTNLSILEKLGAIEGRRARVQQR